MLNVAIIILNWKNAPATIECARTVVDDMARCAGSVGSRLFVVDNGSDVNCVNGLKAWASQLVESRVDLVLNPVNLGFAGGMNKGISAALRNGPVDYFWLLNNDLTVTPGSLSALARSAHESPDVAVWGPTVMDAKSGKVQCAGGCIYNRWLGREKRVFAGLDTEDLARRSMPALDYVYGAAMFVRADVISRLDGLNEIYFLYYEELDLAENLLPGDRLGWCAGARVDHAGGASTTGRAVRPFAAYHAALSAFRFTWRYHPLCLPTVVLARVFGLAIYALRDMNPGLALAPLRAFRDFLGTG
jgi:GT2 family glycosyltransferase